MEGVLATKIHGALLKNKNHISEPQEVWKNKFEFVYKYSMYDTSFVQICYYPWSTQKYKCGIKNKFFLF
jgi:hypothetical protein